LDRLSRFSLFVFALDFAENRFPLFGSRSKIKGTKAGEIAETALPSAGEGGAKRRVRG
jgi:hypothetical protein